MTTAKKNAAVAAKSAQAAQKKHTSSKLPPLADELIQLIDDFAEFSDISGFLCHAFASTLADHERLNPEIRSGARICSDWLQKRTGELNVNLRHVHAGYAAERQKKSS